MRWREQAGLQKLFAFGCETSDEKGTRLFVGVRQARTTGETRSAEGKQPSRFHEQTQRLRPQLIGLLLYS